jgi:hypothetical protein
MSTKAFTHLCESCGKEELLTPQESFDQGWDYPPNMGAWGVISPRTCGNCIINTTVWWALVVDKKSPKELTPAQIATVERILEEIPQ